MGNWLNNYFGATLIRFLGLDQPLRNAIDFRGAGVTVEDDADTGATKITITGGGGGGGEANTTSNVGTGEGLLAKAKSGVNLPFRSLKAGANIAIANNTDDVTIGISGTIPAGNQAAQTMAGDVTGTTAASVVSKVRGAAVGTAAGALTTGHTLRVTGASAADWGAIDLANANATTGALAVAKLAGGSSGQGLVTASGVPTWATVVTSGSNLGSGAQLYTSVSSGALQLRSIIGTSPITATQNTNDVTLSLGTVPVAKGGTGLTSIGAANTVLKSDGTSASWATIVDANVSASAALTWSKFGGGTQTANPTGFDFVGLARGRVYQREFYDAMPPVTTSPYSRARKYSFTLPDNATTKITANVTAFNSSDATAGRNSNAVYEAVYRRVGGTVTKIRETSLIAVTNFDVESDNSTSTVHVLVTDNVAGTPAADTVAHVRIELDCASTADLPDTIAVTSAEAPG